MAEKNHHNVLNKANAIVHTFLAIISAFLADYAYIYTQIILSKFHLLRNKYTSSLKDEIVKYNSAMGSKFTPAWSRMLDGCSLA